MAAENSLDPDVLFDELVEGGVLEVDPGTDRVTLTEAFDASLQIYEDTYTGVSDEEFHSAIAEVFGFEDEETAAERVDKLDVTRQELAAFLAIRSHLDEPPAVDRLAVMAGMVADVDVGSPVPDSLEELTDDTFRAYLEDHEDAVLIVWRHHCDPCDGLKRDLEDIMELAPADVSFAGVDGEAADAFRETFDIQAAPTTLFFHDGDLADMVRGRRSVERFDDLFEAVYG